MKNINLPLFAILLTLYSCTKEEEFIKKDLRIDIESAANNASISAQAEMEPNELLVKFKKGTSSGSKAKAWGLMNASVKEHIHTASMKSVGDNEGVYLLRANINAMDAISKAKGLLEIEYAEPNWIYKHQATSNESFYTNGNLWGMYGSSTSPANQFGSGAATAWSNNKIGSSSIYIGIIDEICIYTHETQSYNA